MTTRNGGGTGLGRRGLLAGAAALVAGGVAKLAGPGRVEATHDQTLNFHLGQGNDASASTTLRRRYGTTPTPGLSVIMYRSDGASSGLERQDKGDAIQGASLDDNAAGVYGFATGNGAGILGRGFGVGVRGEGIGGSPAGSGVVGVAYRCEFGNTSDVGVGGSGRGQGATVLGKTGVLGITDSGVGVQGWAMAGGVGIRGSSNFGGGPDFGGTGIGVEGRSATGTGVRGQATGGTGVRGDAGDVFGVSTNASGTYGFSGLSFGAAGVSNAGVGVYATSGSYWGLHAVSSSSFAAVFSGPVYINGSYTATGAKSAAVKNKRGEHRRMYCQEAPEPWFEDFGRAELKDGRAVVPLDPEFDEVVKGDDYHVFLTEYGDLGGLYVADVRPHRFEVRSRSGASGRFSFRVVARRLDDLGRRLEKIDVPDFAKARRPPAPPDLPSAPSRPER